MKATVNFEGTHVVVPCHEGNLSIRDLVNKAIVRYKKLTCKPADHWVKVYRIRLSRDNGILDMDDCVADVLDDRELLVAEFSEQFSTAGPPCTTIHHNGDGASGSSVGTASPEMLQVVSGGGVGSVQGGGPQQQGGQGGPTHPRDTETDVLVTRHDLHKGGSNLTVRGGGTPSIGGKAEERSPPGNSGSPQQPRQPPASTQTTMLSVNGGGNHSVNLRGTPAGFQHPPVVSSTPVSSPQRNGNYMPLELNKDFFNRNSARRSLGNNPALIRWLEAQENLEQRRDPVGAPTSPGVGGELWQQTVVMVRLAPNRGHGIHLGPWLDAVTGELRGIDVRKVEEGGSFAEDGQVNTTDKISEVNGASLRGLSFKEAHRIFIAAIQKGLLRLVVSHNTAATGHPSSPGHKPGPPHHQYSRTAPSSPNTAAANSSAFRPVGNRHQKPPGDSGGAVVLQQQLSSQADLSPHSSSLGSPGDKPRPPPRAASTKLSGLNTSLNQANVRTLGQKITIVLTKAPGGGGLGFTLTSRDNPTGGPNPIYVKKILPQGAAILDGRLMVGDRLLRVDDQDATRSGMTHRLVAELLRATPEGGTVSLVVSRQASATDNQQAAESFSGGVEKSPTPDQDVTRGEDEELTMMIPLLSNCGGLGINVKWRSDSGLPPGVYIDSIVPGRAAHADARLAPHDRILAVDSTILAGNDSRLATEQLRGAIGAARDTIVIRVARLVSSSMRHVVHQPIPVKPDLVPRPMSTGPPILPDKPPTLNRDSRLSASMDYLHANDDDSDDTSEYRAARFHREGPGRQSMSEKRHAHLDATQLKFYQNEWLQSRQRKEEVDRPYATLPSASRMRQLQKLKGQQQAGQGSQLQISDSTQGSQPQRPLLLDQELLPYGTTRPPRQLPSIPVTTPISYKRLPPPNYNSALRHDVDVTASELAHTTTSKLHCRVGAAGSASTPGPAPAVPKHGPPAVGPKPRYSILKHAVSVESLLSNNAHGYNGVHGPTEGMVGLRASDSMNSLQRHSSHSGGHPDAATSSQFSGSGGGCGTPGLKRGGATNSSFRRAVDRSYQAEAAPPSSQIAGLSSNQSGGQVQGHPPLQGGQTSGGGGRGSTGGTSGGVPVEAESMGTGGDGDSKKAAKKSALANFKDIFKLGKSSRKSSLTGPGTSGNSSRPAAQNDTGGFIVSTPQQQSLHQQPLPQHHPQRHSSPHQHPLLVDTTSTPAGQQRHSSVDRVRLWQQQNAMEMERGSSSSGFYEQLGGAEEHRARPALTVTDGRHAPQLRPSVGNPDRLKQVQHLRGRMVETHRTSTDGGSSYFHGNRRAKSLHLDDDEGYQNLDSLYPMGSNNTAATVTLSNTTNNKYIPPPIPARGHIPIQSSSSLHSHNSLGVGNKKHQVQQQQLRTSSAAPPQVLPNRPTTVKHYTVGDENTVYALVSKPTKKGLHVS